MSLQRVIELARRQGMPIVVTDVAGREPMVLLPLEIYEDLLNEPNPSFLKNDQSKPNSSQESSKEAVSELVAQKPTAPLAQPVVFSEPVSVPTPAPVPARDGLRVRQRDEDRVQTLHRSLDVVSEAAEGSSRGVGAVEQDIPLEERFSFDD